MELSLSPSLHTYAPHLDFLLVAHTYNICVTVWHIPYQFQLPGHGHPLSTMKVPNYWYLVMYIHVSSIMITKQLLLHMANGTVLSHPPSMAGACSIIIMDKLIGRWKLGAYACYRPFLVLVLCVLCARGIAKSVRLNRLQIEAHSK